MTTSGNEGENLTELHNPTPEMMKSDEFNAIWDLIKDWKIYAPNLMDSGNPTGAHVRAIIEAINKSRPETIKSMVKKLRYESLGGSTRQAIVEKLDAAISNTIT